MPIYEYRCDDCKTVFARLQPVTASTATIPCPSCGSSDTERVLSAFATSASSTSDRVACPSPAACGGGGG